MSISVQCQQCGKQFLAPEQMAGKRVRCKQCGNVFSVPPADLDPAEANGLSALADLASDTSSETAVGGSVAPARHEPAAAAAAAAELPDDPWAEMNLAGFESSSARSNQPFRYPYSRAVDQYIPFLLVFGGLAWMVMELINRNTSGRPWIPIVQVLLITVLYMLVVLPITTYGVKAGARKARFSLPPNALWRTAATFWFPVMFGVILWLVLGSVGSFILGCLVGMMVAFGAYWLLFRPMPEEIGRAFAFACGWFILSVAMGVGVMFVLNLLLFTIMSTADSAHEFRASPLGPAFTWNAPPPPEPAPSQNPGQASPVVANVPEGSVPMTPMEGATLSPVEPTETVPPAPAPLDVLVQTPPPPADPGAGTSGTALPEPGTVATPPANAGDPSAPQLPAPDLAIAKGTATDAGQTEIPVIDATPQPQTPSQSPIVQKITELTGPAPGQAMVTSTAGGPLFAITKSVDPEVDQVSLWNAESTKMIGAVKFRHDAGVREQYAISPGGNYLARIVAWPRRHIQIWSFADKRVLEPLDLTDGTATPSLIGFLGEDVVTVLWERGGRRLLQSWNVQTRRVLKQVDLPNYEATRGNVAISPDGRQVAVAAKMETPGGDRRGQIQIVDMTLGRAVRRLPINALESRWPVAPAGLAYSPDGSQLAILLENRGDVLLVCWRVGDGVVLHEHIFRAGTLVDADTPPFVGNALGWIDDGNAWLAYGRKVIDTRKGNIIGHIDLPNVADQYVIDQDSAALLHADPDADPSVSIVDLKQDELASVRRGRKPTPTDTDLPSDVEPIEVVP